MGTFVGPYEVIREIASGGMATTYLARKTGEGGFERLVVLKRVHPHLLKDPSQRDAIRDEARVAASIHHPNVVPVEDVVDVSGELCLVMPYVESLSLAALVSSAKRAGERVPAAVASRVLLDALAGLDAAHEAKDLRGDPLEIVHRDVSPRNVLVGSDGQARLIDFGVAKAARRSSQTQSGVMKGTISYMAPEQLRRRELDRRADIFAAGAVLYESLTGERLFEGKDDADVLLGVLADEIPKVAETSRDLSPEVDEVLARALSRDPDERFPTAAAFAEALERALRPAPAREVARLVERLGAEELAGRREAIRGFFDRMTTTTTTATVAAETTKPPRRRKRTLAFVLTITLLPLALAAVFGASRARNEVNVSARDVAKASPRGSAETNPSAETPAIANKGAHDQPAAPSSVDSRAETSPTRAPAGSALPAAPSAPSGKPHKKAETDFYRAKELQDNPYR